MMDDVATLPPPRSRVVEASAVDDHGGHLTLAFDSRSDASALVELKMGSREGEERPTGEEHDGHEQPPAPKHQNHVMLNNRQAIEATLRRLNAGELDQRHRDQVARDVQRDHTRSLVKLMHLDTADQAKIATHTAIARQQHEIAQVLEAMRCVEDRYQCAKKELAMIPDKSERHEAVEKVKRVRDDEMRPLRARLQELDPTARPGTASNDVRENRLPSLTAGGATERKASSKVYRECTDRIRELQKTRKTMMDPYIANLKMAKLWARINDHERALEHYEKATKSLSDKDKLKIPADELKHALESERRRKREALEYLFLRAIRQQERKEAAVLMKKYLELALPRERHESVAYLESLLRSQDYVEDPSLMSPEAVTESILCTKSLGPLTDLRFQLLQELLDSSPKDPFLLESVANMHIRKHEFDEAKSISDRFVSLPQVKRMNMFASFAEYSPSLR